MLSLSVSVGQTATSGNQTKTKTHPHSLASHHKIRHHIYMLAPLLSLILTPAGAASPSWLESTSTAPVQQHRRPDGAPVVRLCIQDAQRNERDSLADRCFRRGSKGIGGRVGGINGCSCDGANEPAEGVAMEGVVGGILACNRNNF